MGKQIQGDIAQGNFHCMIGTGGDGSDYKIPNEKAPTSETGATGPATEEEKVKETEPAASTASEETKPTASAASEETKPTASTASEETKPAASTASEEKASTGPTGP